MVSIIIGVLILSACAKEENPVDFYRESMIEVLNDYKKGKLDYNEASSKLKSIGKKVSDVGDEEYKIEGGAVSAIAANISYDLLHGDVTAAQIDEWIEKIKK